MDGNIEQRAWRGGERGSEGIWARIALDSTNGRSRPYGYVELYDRIRSIVTFIV